MTLIVLTLLALAASASLCGWAWNHALIENHRRPTISWAIGGLGAGALMAATIAAVLLIPQHLTRSTPMAAPPPTVPRTWPASIVDLRPPPPVAESLKQAQLALRNDDWQGALESIRRAEAVPARTSREDYLIAQFRTFVLAHEKDYAGMAEPIEAQLRYPQLDPAERARLLTAAAQVHFAIKRYERVIPHAQAFLARYPKDRDMRALLVQSLYLLKRYDELAPILERLIDDERAEGNEIPVNWLQMRISAESLRGNSGVPDLIQALAREFPQHADTLLNPRSR